MKVADVLRCKGQTLYTTQPEATLAQAVAVMVEKDIGSLVVVDRADGEQVAGMLTFREVLKAVAEGDNRADVAALRVRDVMAEAIACTPDDEMEAVSQKMLSNRRRYMPVVEAGSARLLGVVSFFDMAKATMESRDFENQLLKAYIREWPQAPCEVADEGLGKSQ